MKRLLGLLLVLSLFIVPTFAQEDDEEITDAPTIADIVTDQATAEENSEFTTLFAALEAADPMIVETLSDPEQELTVFAPTDAAFATLQEELGEDTFNEILTEEGTPRLNEILLYHTVEGVLPSSEVITTLEGEDAGDMGDVSIPFVTMSRQTFDVAGTVDEEGALDLDAGITVGEANLVLDMIDIEAANGVIHVIDAVLVPELDTIADVVTASAEAEDAQFTTLLAAVQEADPAVLNLLADPSSDLTVFAPTDEAFAAIEGLDDIIADTRFLTQVLQYHVLPGSVYSFQLGDLVDEEGNAIVVMADGSEATITVSEDSVTINDANIVLEMVDIETSNGVIHVIDAVLLPPVE